MMAGIVGDRLDGESVFRLYDTFGFPIDLTREITAERGINIDEEGFTQLMKLQKERARAARAGLGDVGWSDETGELIDKSLKTTFVGYDALSCDAEIVSIISGNEAASVLSAGNGVILLDKTPFYAESGGQVGDHRRYKHVLRYF